jgi:predicted esterase
MMPRIRRPVLPQVVLALGLAASLACNPLDILGSGFSGDPQLDVAWNTARSGAFATGHVVLSEDSAGTTGRVFVPAHFDPDTPIGLLVMLHGAGSAGQQYIGTFQALADAHDFIILAPDSKQLTWDMLSTTKVGVDAARIGQAIEYVLQRASIDPERIWLAGHSDGASYALTIGTANGDRFRKLVVFAAGVYWTPQKVGRPPVRVVHGRFDPVFAFGDVQGEVVGPLERAGYPVTFAPHNGGHEIGSEAAEAAILWVVGSM